MIIGTGNSGSGINFGIARTNRTNTFNMRTGKSIHLNNSISATVTKLIEEAGVHLAAGESIEYIIIDASGKKQPHKAKPVSLYAFEDGYDIEKYCDMVLDAASTLHSAFGRTKEALSLELLPERKRPRPRAARVVPEESITLELFVDL